VNESNDTNDTEEAEIEALKRNLRPWWWRIWAVIFAWFVAIHERFIVPAEVPALDEVEEDESEAGETDEADEVHA